MSARTMLAKQQRGQLNKIYKTQNCPSKPWMKTVPGKKGIYWETYFGVDWRKVAKSLSGNPSTDSKNPLASNTTPIHPVPDTTQPKP